MLSRRCGGINVFASGSFESSIEGSGTMAWAEISPRLKYPSAGLNSSLNDSLSDSSTE
jgi:hypothetical protein